MPTQYNSNRPESSEGRVYQQPGSTQRVPVQRSYAQQSTQRVPAQRPYRESSSQTVYTQRVNASPYTKPDAANRQYTGAETRPVQRQYTPMASPEAPSQTSRYAPVTGSARQPVAEPSTAKRGAIFSITPKEEKYADAGEKKPLISMRAQQPKPARKSTVADRIRKPDDTAVRKKKRSILFIVLAVALCACIMGLVIWISGYYGDDIAKGVHINGIDMSGKTRAEALTLLGEQLEKDKDSIRINLVFEERSWVFTRTEMDILSPIELTVDKAMTLGREGSFIQRLKDCREYKETMPNLEAYEELDASRLDAAVARVAAELDIPAQNAVITFDVEDGASFHISDEVPGRQLDQPLLKEIINKASDSSYDMTIQLSTNETKAAVTKESLKPCTAKLSFFETEISGSSKRVSNVKLALSRFDGMVIEPGETVSFNETTGERTEENGYLEAPGINADKGLEDTLGGGVCQASTTLYNAALMAGCNIVERHRHSFPSSYVKKGFDAMVNWPNKDLRFTNTSDYPIYIHTAVKEVRNQTMAQVWFYGRARDDGYTFERKSVIVSEIDAPEPEMIKDEQGKYTDYVYYDDEAYIAVASRAGMVVDAFLVTKDANGEVVEEKKLYTDEFEKIKGKHYVGTHKRPEDEVPVANKGCYLLPNAKIPGDEGNDPEIDSPD